MKKTVFLVLAIAVIAAFSISAQTTPAAGAGTATANQDMLQEKTLIDFAKLQDADVNDEVKLDKWRIKLSGLSDVAECRIKSGFSKKDAEPSLVTVDSTKLGDLGETFNKCLGIRIHFAVGYNNDWAQIMTENPISEFRVTQEEGSGVLRNMGPIAQVSLMVKGMNYMHSLEVRMQDQDGKYKNVNFGGLYFSGWKRLTWDNPDFISDKRKRDIVKIHLYPSAKPQLRFDSLVIYKAPSEKGGDFVVYVKDVKVKFEPYYTREIKDIDDEAVWGIQSEEDKTKENRESLIRFLKYSGSTAEDTYLKEEQKRKDQKK